MIKICANLSKKVPLPGIDYSSQQYGAAMEIEVSDADQPEIIQQRIRELYLLLSNTIDEQLSGAPQKPIPALPAPARQQAVQSPPPVQQRAPYTNGHNRIAAPSTNGNGNGRRITCTEAQAKCIYAICKAQGLDMVSVLADYNVSDARDLHVKDASRLIDDLKARQNSNGTTAQ
jgi:hypothetical protein